MMVWGCSSAIQYDSMHYLLRVHYVPTYLELGLYISAENMLTHIKLTQFAQTCMKLFSSHSQFSQVHFCQNCFMYGMVLFWDFPDLPCANSTSHCLMSTMLVTACKNYLLFATEHGVRGPTCILNILDTLAYLHYSCDVVFFREKNNKHIWKICILYT